MKGGSRRAEPALIVVLILAALALDLFWVRPASERLERLSARRTEAQTLVASLGAVPEAERRPTETDEAASDEPGVSEIGETGPVRVLESAQRGRRLLQRELRLLEHRDLGPIRETSYYLEVYGEYRDVFVFLKDLETGKGLVAVDRFRMVTASGDPGVTLFLWATLLTPAGPAGVTSSGP